MKHVYLLAAIVGAVIPYFFFLQHMGDAGLALGDFLAQGFANPVRGRAQTLDIGHRQQTAPPLSGDDAYFSCHSGRRPQVAASANMVG